MGAKMPNPCPGGAKPAASPAPPPAKRNFQDRPFCIVSPVNGRMGEHERVKLDKQLNSARCGSIIVVDQPVTITPIFTPNPEQIAQICHEVNKALCEAYGDCSQKPWDEAEQWQRDSAVKGVRFALENPDAGPSSQHDAWSADKIADGWKHGPVKDAAKKEHPCLVPYDDLPVDQRAKDFVFRGVVTGCLAISTACYKSFIDSTEAL